MVNGLLIRLRNESNRKIFLNYTEKNEISVDDFFSEEFSLI